MIQKELDKIAESDIQSLIDNAVREGKSIDYKLLLPGNSDSDKKEFLADVSSFANASGGDLIFGVSEQNGEPINLAGLDIINIDQEILKLDNIVRDGVEPRIPSINIRDISLSNGKKLVIIRISKSWISPHRVTFKGHDKFYSRSSNGKFPLDVGELRIAFNMADAVEQKIRKFREERIIKLAANETPIDFVNKPKTVLHIIPFTSFGLNLFDFGEMSDIVTSLRPIYARGWNHRYTLDGYLTYSTIDSRAFSYVEVYKTGKLEAVCGELLRETIPWKSFENEIIDALAKYIYFLKKINIELPLVVSLTLIGVKGFAIGSDPYAFTSGEKIDRDVLFLPEVVVDNFDNTSARILKPCFDALWNACGYARSKGYDEKGDRLTR